MANVTEPRNTRRMISPYDMLLNYPCNAGAVLYKGAMAALNTSGVVIRAGGAAAGATKVIGRIKSNLPSALSTDRCEVETGIFKWGNNGANTVTAADRGKICYMVDDQTVSMLNTNMVAGRVIDVDTDGVWVLTEIGASTP